MSAPSATVTMFRALVMLICVIAIPLAAIFGSSLPGVIKAVQSGRWPTLAEWKGETNKQASLWSEAPAFIPSAAAAPINGAAGFPAPVQNQPPATAPLPLDSGLTASAIPPTPPGMAISLGTPGASNAALPTSVTPRWNEMSPPATASQIVPVAYNSPVDPSHGPAAGNLASAALAPNTLATSASATARDPFAARAAAPVTVTAEIAAASPPLPTGATASEPYVYIQKRLQALGATYYVLETLHPESTQKWEYRFYCRMAIGGNVQVTRSFNAIDNDPVQAMTQVLQQVEAWRSERPYTGSSQHTP